MVSIKHAQEVAEKRERQERLLRARRQASAVAVANARNYRDMKTMQRAKVNSELEEQWLRQCEQKQHDQEARKQKADIEKGLAMKAAQEFAAEKAQFAESELRAWEAERSLEEERHAVAMQRQTLVAKQKEAEQSVLSARRQQVKEQEANRSLLLVQKHRTEQNTSLAATPVSIPPSAPRTKSGETAVHKASQYASKRQEELKALNNRVEAHLQVTNTRAVEAMTNIREEQERERLQKEQERLLRNSMVDNAIKSTRYVMQSDYQEQEARRSQHVHRAVHHAFEKTFLSGAWQHDEVKRYHEAPPSQLLEHVDPLQLSDVTQLTGGVSGANHVTELRATEFSPAVVVKNGSTLLQSTVVEEEPLPSVELPQPTPRTEPSLPMAEDGNVAALPQHAEEEVYVDPSPPALQEGVDSSPDGTHEESSEASSHPPTNGLQPNGELQILRENNERFLSELASLHKRLDAAAMKTQSATDDSINTSATGATDDVSVSTMSSAELHRVGGLDASTDSSDSDDTNVSSSYQAKKLMMSAEQLRNALLRMKSVAPVPQ